MFARVKPNGDEQMFATFFDSKIARFAAALASAALATAILSPAAHAGPVVSGVQNPAPGFGCTNFTCAFTFVADRDLTVTDLGAFDTNLDGFASNMEVGLWTIAGDLLASVTLPTGASGVLIENHRYLSIVPVSLTAGQEYVVGVATSGFNGLAPFLGASGIVTDGITFTGGGFAQGPTLRFPTNFDNSPRSFGNFIVEMVNVPAPGGLAILGFGLAGLILARRRKGPAIA